MRPGFGPSAEPAAFRQREGVTPFAVCHSLLATARRQPACRVGFGIRASRSSVRSVRHAEIALPLQYLAPPVGVLRCVYSGVTYAHRICPPWTSGEHYGTSFLELCSFAARHDDSAAGTGKHSRHPNRLWAWRTGVADMLSRCIADRSGHWHRRGQYDMDQYIDLSLWKHSRLVARYTHVAGPYRARTIYKSAQGGVRISERLRAC